MFQASELQAGDPVFSHKRPPTSGSGAMPSTRGASTNDVTKRIGPTFDIGDTNVEVGGTDTGDFDQKTLRRIVGDHKDSSSDFEGWNQRLSLNIIYWGHT